jgi:hypothetical protein
MRFSLRFLLIACPLTAIVASAGIGVWRAYYYGIDDAYAEWGAVNLVITYMESHDGRWPPNWEAIRPVFEIHGGRVGGWSFEQYKRRIGIDFTLNIDEIRREALRSDKPTFNAIWATHRTGVHFGNGPNEMLHYYFRNGRPGNG